MKKGTSAIRPHTTQTLFSKPFPFPPWQFYSKEVLAATKVLTGDLFSGGHQGLPYVMVCRGGACPLLMPEAKTPLLTYTHLLTLTPIRDMMLLVARLRCPGKEERHAFLSGSFG